MDGMCTLKSAWTPRVPLDGKRVLVAVSGGVDSSVAAALLAAQGAEVVGATFRNYCFSAESDLPGRSCCSVDAAADALAVCEHLGLEHALVDETARFGEAVVDDFHAEYAAGRTPNPCVRCNADVRFPRLLETAGAEGFDYVATGHYARIVATADGAGGADGTAERLYLARGLDADKDQSYFLAGLAPEGYGRVLFPLGGIPKARTRELARAAGLSVAEKRESQDVCFLAGRSLADHLGERGGLTPGPVLGPGGEPLGEHAGVELYTVGQRHGLGVAAGRPLYVTALDAATGEVRLGEAEALLTARLVARSAWLRPGIDAAGGELTAKVRYRGGAARVVSLSLDGDRLDVALAEPVRAVAPGQSLVLYAGDRVVGHGILDRA